LSNAVNKTIPYYLFYNIWKYTIQIAPVIPNPIYTTFYVVLTSASVFQYK